jgi:hypothetical protein
MRVVILAGGLLTASLAVSSCSSTKDMIMHDTHGSQSSTLSDSSSSTITRNVSGSSSSSSSSLLSEADLAALSPTSHYEAIKIGQQFFAAYARSSRAQSKGRQNINKVTWFATTYTLFSIALKAHPNNAIVGTLVGNSVTQLDPILHPGGPEADNTAMAGTSCVMRALNYLNSSDVAPDLQAVLASSEPFSEITAAKASYGSLPPLAMAGYVTFYERNQSAKTAVIISSADMTNAIKQGKKLSEEAQKDAKDENASSSSSSSSSASSASSIPNEKFAGAYSLCERKGKGRKACEKNILSAQKVFQEETDKAVKEKEIKDKALLVSGYNKIVSKNISDCLKPAAA